MNKKSIIILDYSVDRNATSDIRRWMPENADVASLFIDSEASFPLDLSEKGFSHVIHTGSALSINETAPFTARTIGFIRTCVEKGVPQMGICYGHQLICLALLGPQAVRACPNGFEVGWKDVKFLKKAQAMFGTRAKEKVWQHHFDEVIQLPEGSTRLATSSHSEIQSYINGKLKLFGTQFHPEFDREGGNRAFEDDRPFIEKHQFNVDKIVQQGPTFDVSRRLFDFFMAEEENL